MNSSWTSKADHEMDRCHRKGEIYNRLHRVQFAVGNNIRGYCRLSSARASRLVF